MRAGGGDHPPRRRDRRRPHRAGGRGVWAQQTYVTDDAALVVFADTPYDPADYVDADLAVAASGPQGMMRA